MGGSTISDRSLGVVIPPGLPGQEFLPVVRRCEQLGFSEVWVVEGLRYHGGFSQAAAALATSTTLNVGVGILPAGARNVAFTAMEIATLAEMFPGRLTVGVGHGMPAWMPQVGAWPSSPVTLLREYIAALRALLRGDQVTVSGRYVTLTDTALEIPPDDPPLILSGVRGPKSLAVSSRVADGTLLAEPVTPEYFRVAKQQIDAQPGHQVVAYNIAAVDADPGAARELARGALAMVGEPAWNLISARYPLRRTWRHCGPPAQRRRSLRPNCPTVGSRNCRSPAPQPRRWKESANFVTPAPTGIVLWPAGPDPLDSLTGLAQLLP